MNDDMKIEVLRYEQLTKEEKEFQPNNGCGNKNANYLKVWFSGEKPIIYSDAMEIEDASFRRDLNWIISLLSKTWNHGYSKGYGDCFDEEDTFDA